MLWAIKFLWAPLVDRFGSARRGHYRRWLLVLQTVQAADRIVVLGDGGIAEEGSHDELLAAGGRYAEFWAQRRRGPRVAAHPYPREGELMPTLPAALAARAARWFGHPATVTAADDPAPQLRRITFTGEALRGRPWTPGQEVEFRVDDRNFRHYTPAVFDRAAGHLEVVFATRADGPGSRWARALSVGDEVGVMGPGGGVGHLGTAHLTLLGDVTALGLFHGLLGAVPPGAAITGTVEVAAEDAPYAAVLVPGLDILVTAGEPGSALAAWLADRPGPPPEDGRAVLAGHTQSIQRLRVELRGSGYPRRSITTKAHWATGRAGL